MYTCILCVLYDNNWGFSSLSTTVCQAYKNIFKFFGFLFLKYYLYKYIYLPVIVNFKNVKNKI